MPETETEYFLKNGKMRDETKRELSNVLEIQQKEYWSIWIKNKIKDLLLYWKINKNNNPGYKRYYKKYKDLELENKPDNKEIDICNIDTKDYIQTVLEVCQIFWISIPKSAIKWKLYYTKNDDEVWESNSGVRKITIEKSFTWDHYFYKHIFIHEFLHHICEMFFVYKNKVHNMNNWYWFVKKGWSFLTEWFTDLLTYKILCKIQGQKQKYTEENWKILWYTNQIQTITKLMPLISQKLNKSPEYIYNYMMRWYLIKWYKWLNLFYQAFGKNFLKWVMELWTDEEDEIKFIKLVEEDYKQLWFDNPKSAKEYFDHKNKPSQEIGDIMGIER